jgi:hypothetical protein
MVILLFTAVERVKDTLRIFLTLTTKATIVA